MDQYIFEESSSAQGNTESPFVSRQWIWTPDTNQGAYGANTVTFDLSSLYNAQKFIGVNEMYMEVPLVVVLSQDKNNAMLSNDYAVGFKSGYFHLIDSLNIVYDGQTVQQGCNHSDFYTSFKINTSMSYNDLLTIGPTIGVYPDNPTSWTYSTTAGRGGVGIQNNQNAATATSVTGLGQGEAYNNGFLKRQIRTSVNSAAGGGANTRLNALTPDAVVKASLRNTTTLVSNANHALDYQVYFVTATIRLGDISSFFANMPLTKGFYARLTFNMNLGSLKITKTDLTSQTIQQSNIQFPYQTCPLMVAPLYDGGAPNALRLNTAITEVVVGVYIAKVTASLNATINQSALGVGNHVMNSCRIYAPMYEMQPENAEKYITENTKKYVEYEDIQYVPLLNQASGATINFNVSNSVLNPTGLLIMPMISATANAAANQSLYPHSSPFTCEPACTSPLMLNQLNVQLGGVNIFNNSIMYDYEFFMNELHGVNAINGGKTMGLTSGLIDQIGFENIYRYYYVDLERRASDSKTPKSIVLVGQNPNTVSMDLHCFVICKKSIVIDVNTGRVLSASS